MGEELILAPRVSIGWALAVLVSAGAAAFCVAGLRMPSMINDGWRSPTTNRIAFVFCLLLAVGYTALTVLEMFGGAGLALNGTGFERRSLWRSSLYRWDAVSTFKVVDKDDDDWPITLFYQPTAISFRDASRSPKESTTCCYTTLDRLWGHSSEDMARTLNQWRERALAAGARK